MAALVLVILSYLIILGSEAWNAFPWWACVFGPIVLWPVWHVMFAVGAIGTMGSGQTRAVWDMAIKKGPDNLFK